MHITICSAYALWRNTSWNSLGYCNLKHGARDRLGKCCFDFRQRTCSSSSRSTHTSHRPGLQDCIAALRGRGQHHDIIKRNSHASSERHPRCRRRLRRADKCRVEVSPGPGHGRCRRQLDLTSDLCRFYAEGWQSGYDHGRLHGLFEGRELGREKGWEIWEEVGFYEGWARFYLGMLSRKGVVEGGRGKDSR